MNVSEWLDDFAIRHMERIPRSDWQPLGGEFWAAWQASFDRHGVTESEADDASRLLAECPSKYPDAQLSALLGTIRSLRLKAQAAADRGRESGWFSGHAEHAARVARRRTLLARWDAMPGDERAPIRARVIEDHPWLRTVPSMLRLFCAESLEDPAAAGPECVPAGPSAAGADAAS